MRAHCVALLLFTALASAQTGRDAVKPLLVMIKSEWDDPGQDPSQNGVGIVLARQSDRLYIATANHVVRYGPRKAKSVLLRLHWLPGEPKKADVTEHFDTKLDLAVLILGRASELAVPELPFRVLADSTKLKPEESKVRAMGYPGGREWYVRSAPDVVAPGDAESVKFDAAWLAGGYSGGGLFTDGWELAGMIKNDQPPEGEALRIERLIERVKQWGYPVQLAAGGVVIPKPQPTGVVNPRPQRADSVWIEPGTFLMGCSPGDRECDSDERNPPVRTTIAKGFWLKKTEVTQAEFQRVMGSNPSHIKGPNRPVESVTWHEAADYCRKVGGRLPTAAEWEYAARAGTPGPTYGELDAIAWYRDNSKSGTHDVATKQPNGWGLYDMLGNVWEWVSDNYDSNSRELRGGSWYSFSLVTRASNRSRVVPGDRNLTDGFRCSRDD